MLVLASHSPRRRELLLRAGIPFIVRAVEVDERWLPGEAPHEHARRLARTKAEAVPARPGEVILGADTIVTIDGEILGKPSGEEEAVRMLELLSGREHSVITGICLIAPQETVVDCEETRVRFCPLTSEEVLEYARSGEPADKAGAYAIQGLASKFIDRIEGCYFNVVGLPVARVYGHLRRLRQASS